MAFGISGNKSKNKSETTVDSTTDSQSGMEYGEGASSFDKYGYDSGSQYRQNAGGMYGSSMFGGPQFNQMYGNLNNMWQGFQGGPMNQIRSDAGRAGEFMGDVAGKGMGAYENLMQGGRTGATGSAVDPALRESLMASMSDPSQMGRMYEGIVGGAGNEYIDPMIDQMRNDELTRSNRLASGITGSAVGAGQSGSSRQGIAEGLMRSEGARNLASQEATARAGGYDKDLDWKMKIAQQADLGRGQAQDRAIGLLGQGDMNTQYGLGQGQNMQNMGMGMMAPGMQAGMMPFQMAGMYSGAMGGPQQQQWGSQFDRGQGSQYDSGTGSSGANAFGGGSSFEDYMNQYNMYNKSKGSSIGGGLSM